MYKMKQRSFARTSPKVSYEDESYDFFEERSVPIDKPSEDCIVCENEDLKPSSAMILKELTKPSSYQIKYIHLDCKKEKQKQADQDAADRLTVPEEVLSNLSDLKVSEMDWKISKNEYKIKLLSEYPYVRSLSVMANSTCLPTETSLVVKMPSNIAKGLPLVYYPPHFHMGYFQHLFVWKIKTNENNYSQILQSILDSAKNAFPMFHLTAASHEVEFGVVHFVVYVESIDEIIQPSYVGMTNHFISKGALFEKKATFHDLVPMKDRVPSDAGVDISTAHIQFGLKRWDDTHYSENPERPGIQVLFASLYEALYASLTVGASNVFTVSEITNITLNEAYHKQDLFTWRINTQKAYYDSQNPSYIVSTDCSQIFAVRNTNPKSIKQYIPILCNDVTSLNTDLIQRKFAFEPINAFVNYL